ncbi:hypothetical protein DENSPDRAFT_887197 [Dentipellis sp. KUC8613]|nr:hypothetical protein DENSPDRAFT_887197 [Dentipellis sp. KUC8613]
MSDATTAPTGIKKPNLDTIPVREFSISQQVGQRKIVSKRSRGPEASGQGLSNDALPPIKLQKRALQQGKNDEDTAISQSSQASSSVQYEFRPEEAHNGEDQKPSGFSIGRGRRVLYMKSPEPNMLKEKTPDHGGVHEARNSRSEGKGKKRDIGPSGTLLLSSPFRKSDVSWSKKLRSRVTNVDGKEVIELLDSDDEDTKPVIDAGLSGMASVPASEVLDVKPSVAQLHAAPVVCVASTSAPSVNTGSSAVAIPPEQDGPPSSGQAVGCATTAVADPEQAPAGAPVPTHPLPHPSSTSVSHPALLAAAHNPAANAALAGPTGGIVDDPGSEEWMDALQQQKPEPAVVQYPHRQFACEVTKAQFQANDPELQDSYEELPPLRAAEIVGPKPSFYSTSALTAGIYINVIWPVIRSAMMFRRTRSNDPGVPLFNPARCDPSEFEGVLPMPWMTSPTLGRNGEVVLCMTFGFLLNCQLFGQDSTQKWLELMPNQQEFHRAMSFYAEALKKPKLQVWTTKAPDSDMRGLKFSTLPRSKSDNIVHPSRGLKADRFTSQESVADNALVNEDGLAGLSMRPLQYSATVPVYDCSKLYNGSGRIDKKIRHIPPNFFRQAPFSPDVMRVEADLHPRTFVAVVHTVGTYDSKYYVDTCSLSFNLQAVYVLAKPTS